MFVKEFPKKLNVARLPEGGQDLSCALGEAWFARWQEEDPELDFAAPGHLTVRVHLEKHGHDILLRGHLEGRLALSCSRCLEAFSHPLDADFDLLLAPGPGPLRSDEEELSKADLDVDFYTREEVNLEAIVREQVLLTLPLKPLCSETCQGLCPRCGADLNRETCNCRRDESASPLTVLQKLKV